MRIVKLSEKIFPNIKNVHDFFQNDLKTDPIGKFRFTKGRISATALQPNERVLFSYKGVIYYKAVTITGRQNNVDSYKQMYPYYFNIDIDTICPTKIKLHELEKMYKDISKTKISLVHTQGWPIIVENYISEKMWISIRS